jgi:hypothetical protein
MSGAIPPLHQYAFMVWCSVKAQGQLYLYLLPVFMSHHFLSWSSFEGNSFLLAPFSLEFSFVGTDDRIHQVSISDRGEKEDIILAIPCRLALGPNQPPIQWVPGAFSPTVKRPGSKVDHLPQEFVDLISSDPMSSWRGLKLSIGFFIALYLVKHRNNFISYLIEENPG